MHSKSVLGTQTNKTKLGWWEYWIGHCWMTGWQTIGMAFRNWRDLMTGNYENYALMDYDDPYTECRDWFWVTLGEDNCYPKFFLEDLLEMTDRIARGEEKTIPIDDIQAFLDELREEP
jgi:hypothetical protein